MKVLLLGRERPDFIRYLASFGDEVAATNAALTGDCDLLAGVDFLVSYGYRHLLRPDVLDRFPRRAINLHISYLPWNRGADPNLWSFLEDTPKGVSIHYIDPGLDTGDILAQESVVFQPQDTLRSSYETLTRAVEQLFRASWSQIREGTLLAVPQPSHGTLHRSRDRQAFEHLLVEGWETPIRQLIGAALGRSSEEA